MHTAVSRAALIEANAVIPMQAKMVSDANDVGAPDIREDGMCADPSHLQDVTQCTSVRPYCFEANEPWYFCG